MDTRVSAIAAPDYALPLLTQAVRRHLDELRVWDDLRPGMRVTLKPNLLMRKKPEGAVTTHPLVVEAVAAVLGEHGIRNVVVADSPGGPYTRAQLEGVYTACGMDAACTRAGLRLNTDTGYKSLSLPDGALCREFNIIDPVADCDFLINLPKLKTHAMTTLSAGVKNLFGCVPGLQKPELHFRFPQKADFCQMLVDLSLLARPGLTLVDAVDSMEGNGPSGGEVRRTGMTFAARNVYALDLALCRYIGLAPDQALTTAHAISRGLCPASPEDLVWLGEGPPPPLSDWKLPDSRPLNFTASLPRALRGPLDWVERRFLSPRPAIIPAKCVGCGKCAESCAPQAVVIREGKAVLDHKKCIRCYCCHEMCPVGAVKIRRAGLLRF